MLKNAGLDGYFTNHSLRRTCVTRLFQTGTDVKLIKEITGHVSDSVHKYQTTSSDQRMHLSSIIQGDVTPIKLSQAELMAVVDEVPKKSNEEKFVLPKLKLPVAINKEGKSDESKANTVKDVIESAIQAVGNRRAKVKVEVELLD